VSKIIEYASFIVRIWRISDSQMKLDSFEWQSKVEHIQSGKTWTFNSLAQLEAFIRQELEYPELLIWLEIQPEVE